MGKYKPELSQAIFGQPYKEMEVPGNVESVLNILRDEMRLRKMFSDKWMTPFDNSGERFSNNVFECNAYSWAECNCDDALDEDWSQEKCKCGYVPQLYNFKWKDFEVSWYKYLGRGMSMNRSIGGKEIAQMLQECINSLPQKPKRK